MLETEPKIIESYVDTGKVKMVYHYLVDFGDRSLVTAESAECAGEQGMFWPMHGLLYERQGEVWASDNVAATTGQFAAELGLDTKAFASCMASHRHVEKIKAADAAAKAAGVFQRPSFDINGQRLVGAVPFAQFQQLLDAALEGH